MFHGRLFYGLLNIWSLTNVLKNTILILQQFNSSTVQHETYPINDFKAGALFDLFDAQKFYLVH